MNLSQIELALGAPKGVLRTSMLVPAAGLGKMLTILLVVVADQVARALPERGGVAQLLSDPGVARMRRDTDLNHPPRANFDNDERIQLAKDQAGDLHKITGAYRVGMIVD